MRRDIVTVAELEETGHSGCPRVRVSIYPIGGAVHDVGVVPPRAALAPVTNSLRLTPFAGALCVVCAPGALALDYLLGTLRDLATLLLPRMCSELHQAGLEIRPHMFFAH